MTVKPTAIKVPQGVYVSRDGKSFVFRRHI